MSCAELKARLDRYASGTLPPAEAVAFEAHLSDCAACSALLETLEARPVEVATLPKALDPTADLWPGIRERLAPRFGARRRVTLPGWLLAAAAALLVAVSSTVTALLLRQPSSRSAVQSSGVLSPLEAQYVSATAELSAALERARARLAPGTIATIERNLAVIDGALEESRRALAGDPGNALLEQLVIAAWRQKMDFLRRATALPSES